MAKVSLLAIGEVARRVSDMAGQEVGNSWCSAKLKEIDPAEGGAYPRTKKFTGQQVAILAAYAAEWYHKQDAPSFTRWINEHSHPIPQPFTPPVVAERGPRKRSKEDGPSTREIERIVNRAVDAALKDRKVSGQLQGPAKPTNREDDIKPLNRAVNRFVFDHPIDVRSCWKWLQQLWEERNGAKVMRIGDQSFPQWLHSSGNMPQMMDQLQGYLDFMHDEITNKQRRLSL